MYKPLEIARYFLALCNADEGELISNLKLQKLLYYAQGFNLALRGERLFNEQVEAWTYGPVVPSVYHHFKTFGDGALPKPDDLDVERIDPETRELLDEVFQVYGAYSAWKLARMTHDEPPWKEAFERGGQSTPISDRSMLDYFKTLVTIEEET